MPLYLRDKLVSGTGAPGKSAYQTAVEAGYEGTETAFNQALMDVPGHIANNENPHGVTKAQVGLGDVPNVTTNNQTPTYSAATTLATLTSGEKLSVSMGKIMKAITDLIAHIADKGNPHGVTAAQAGADPTGTAASAVSEHNSSETAHSDIRTALAEKAAAAAVTAVQGNLDGHTGDTTMHITAADRTKWDGKQDKLTFDATPTANSTNPVTSGGVKTELDKKANAPKSVSVTLAAASWDSTAKTQTVTVTGVSATETAQMITPTPALASQTAYYDAGILCTGQAADSLTFTANTIPTADLTVYVVIQEVAQG